MAIFSRHFLVGAAIYVCAGISAWAVGEGGTRDIFDYGTGARALAMGNAYTALARGASGLTWNPAALDVMDRPTLETTAAVLPFGGLYTHAAFGIPILKAGTVGVGGGTVTADGINSYSEDFVPGASLSYIRVKAIAGYSQSLGSLPIQLGIALRMDYFNTAGIQTTYVNADMGFRISFLDFGLRARNMVGNELALGLSVKNLLAFSGPKLSLENDVEPVSFTLGVYYGHWFHRFLTARLTLDGSVDTYSNVTGAGGVEFQIFRYYDLRAGYLLGQGFSTGVGIRLLDFEVAYAALFRGNAIAHNFSVNWMIGESRKAKGYRLASEEKESIDLAVSRSVDEEKARLARIQEEIQKKILAEQQRNRESAERQVRDLIASNENSLALAAESNRLVLEQTRLSNELHLTQVTLSNQLAFEVLKSTTQQWVDTVRRSNEMLVRELSQSNQQWAEALRISNQAALAKVTQSNEMAIKTLMQANNQAREALAAKARDNINKLNREIADTKARQKTIETMYNSALSAFNTGNADEALVQFKKILELDPLNQEVLNFVKKIEDSKRPVENYSAEEVELYREGMKHFLKKDYAKAIEVWESLLKRYPYNNLAIQGIEKAKKRQKGN